jgi:hypothetical protein
MQTWRNIATCMHRAVGLSVLLLVMGMLSIPPASQGQILDICGCAGSPESLGVFDTLDPTTYPAGTIEQFRRLDVPLPADGVFIFDSLNLVPRSGDLTILTVRFIHNAANTPVTILVAGDVTVGSGVTVDVSGDPGVNGSDGVNGTGGLGGPGGFRGGDGAYQNVNFASDGGEGFGPSGGAAGTASPLTGGGAGGFVGTPELRPLLGGAGGGGGASSASELGCSGGGGGGGGGAILTVANGTITIDGTIQANGGNGGLRRGSTCSSPGGAGSGGAIRLVADTITGNGRLLATGGSDVSFGTGNAPAGRITLEAITNSFSASTFNVNPVATRFPAPGPIVNLFTPTVRITDVEGVMVPEPPRGGFGVVDIILPAPGPVLVNLATTGVPTGTNVEVTVKPRVGGAAMVETFMLTAGDCDAGGDCFPATTFDLAAGAYTIEARATFQTP